MPGMAKRRMIYPVDWHPNRLETGLIRTTCRCSPYLVVSFFFSRLQILFHRVDEMQRVKLAEGSLKSISDMKMALFLPDILSAL